MKNKSPSRIFINIIFSLAFALTIACEPKPISEISPEDGIQRIRTQHEKSNWEKVTTEVNEYRSRYPYTQYSIEAELLQADAFFQSKRYPEAVAAYEEFQKKNPNHAKLPLAAFRIAKSYDAQSPEEIDREQDAAFRAIDKFNQYLEKYPNSEWSAEAKDRILVLRRRVAENAIFVARFYWKKDKCQGALSRYLSIIEKYSSFADLYTEAIERASNCYDILALQLEADSKSDLIFYFKNETPDSLRKKGRDIKSKQPVPAEPSIK